jgi:hypothetical protein
MHTSGEEALQAFLRSAREVPSDIAFEWHSQIWRLCRGNSKELMALTNLQNLRKWTPIVKFVKGGQVIPWDLEPNMKAPFDCTQCIGISNISDADEKNRFINWTMSGWKGYHGVQQTLKLFEK